MVRNGMVFLFEYTDATLPSSICDLVGTSVEDKTLESISHIYAYQKLLQTSCMVTVCTGNFDVYNVQNPHATLISELVAKI